MSGVAKPRGSVDSRAHGFPSRSILQGVALACVVGFGLLLATTAQAGSLYRCAGSSGEAVYTSSAVGYHGCRRIGSFGTTAPRAKPRPPARVTLTRVSGAVSTTADSLHADGAQAVTLAQARGDVLTTAQAQGAAQAQHVSLAAVRGAAMTSARTPAPEGAPGQWSYRQSAGTDAAMPPAATAEVSTGSTAQVLRGAVYRIVRKDGSVEYTNLRPPGSAGGRAVTMLFSYIATCVACDVRSPIHWDRVHLNLTDYAQVIRAASAEYGVDEAFLRAVIHAESAFNPRALSIKGAQGLMQLMPGTASDMGVLDAFNTEQNIRGGARYLGLLLHDFAGSERLAAAAYNAGPGAVQRYNGVPPFAETMVYVGRVATLRKRYEAALHPPLAVNTAAAPTRL